MPVVQMPLYAVRNDRPTLAQSALLAALGLGLVFCGWCVPAAAEEPAPRVGNPAPVLAFKDCRGVSHSINWSAGAPKASVLFFFDPETPACLMEMTFLDTLIARARDFGLAVYAIESRGRAPADINQSLERYCALYRDPSFAMVPDPYFRLGGLFRIRRTPTTFLVDGSGSIVLFREGFEQADAVELTRNVERLLGQEAGFFSFALRSLGVSAQDETALQARLAARAEEGAGVIPKALLAGDLAPALEFTDLIGRSSRWEWPAPGAPVRVVLFWGGLTVPDIEALAFFEKIFQAAHGAGLDILAVATGGRDTAHVQELLERYRKYHSPPSFHIVADPDARLGKLFGGDERTPRTYLVGADGAIVYAAAGFTENQAATLAGKIEHLIRTAGMTLPPLGTTAEGPLIPAAPDEAPSIRQQQEREDALGANLSQGDYCYYNGNWDKALSYYLRVMEIDPRQVSVLARIAQIYERIDDPAKAREMWELVLALQADHAEARKRLQKLGR